jgi:hypothetical protein
MTWLAGCLAAGPIRVFHEARVCDHVAALRSAAICGPICFAAAEVLGVILFKASIHTSVHWPTSIEHGLDTAQEEVLGRDKRE